MGTYKRRFSESSLAYSQMLEQTSQIPNVDKTIETSPNTMKLFQDFKANIIENCYSAVWTFFISFS
jgi:hypothetical protein